MVQPQDGTECVGRPMIRNPSRHVVGELVVGARCFIGYGRLRSERQDGVDGSLSEVPRWAP